jgi:RNA polymerase sigma factor (sigma-70 family)
MSALRDEDTALVTAARAGDREALDALLAAHLPLVYGVVRRALRDGDDVDDVVQETMLRAVQGLSSLREPEKFRTWLVAIAVRQVRDRLRQRGRGPLVQPFAPDDLEYVTDPHADFVAAADDRLGLAEQRRELVRASRWLSAADRRVLELWWRESAGAMTRAEVAAALSLSQPHTAVRVQRMKARLAVARTLTRAWFASPRCAGLTDAAMDWDGRFDPQWLGRLGRHVTGCDLCTAAAAPASPDRLLGVGAAAWFTTSIVAPLGHGLRRLAEYASSKYAALAGAGAAGVTAVVVLAVHYPMSPPSAIAPQAVPTVTRPADVRTATPSTAGPTAPVTPAATARPGAPSAGGVTAADIFVSPAGDDANPGTADRPLASLAAAVATVQPGQTIAVRAGVYQPTDPILIARSGTATARIVLSNYLGEHPVLDGSRIPSARRFISQTASYWTVQGFEIRNAPGHAYGCLSCQHSVFRRLSIHDSGNTALTLEDPGTVDNAVVDSDFYASTDGLGIKNGSGAGNVVRNCRLYLNSGDGLDLSEFADPVTVTSTWAFGNGGNGIKLGGGSPAPAADHVISHSASWDNAGYGFTEAGNRGRLLLTNNTAYRNGAAGFALVYSSSVLRHNLALANESDSWLGDAVDDADNSWNQAGWATTDLRSGDPTGTERARGPDGALPETTFLRNRRDAAMGASMRGSP